MGMTKGSMLRGLCFAVVWWALPAGAQVNEPGFAGCVEAVRWMEAGRGFVPEDPFATGVCLGTIQSVRDMAVADKVELGQAMFCVPQEKRNTEIVQGFVRSRYFDGGGSFTLSVIGYLAQSYPCGK